MGYSKRDGAPRDDFDPEVMALQTAHEAMQRLLDEAISAFEAARRAFGLLPGAVAFVEFARAHPVDDVPVTDMILSSLRQPIAWWILVAMTLRGHEVQPDWSGEQGWQDVMEVVESSVLRAGIIRPVAGAPDGGHFG
jgi:hypothetical protein